MTSTRDLQGPNELDNGSEKGKDERQQPRALPDLACAGNLQDHGGHAQAGRLAGRSAMLLQGTRT